MAIRLPSRSGAKSGSALQKAVTSGKIKTIRGSTTSSKNTRLLSSTQSGGSDTASRLAKAYGDKVNAGNTGNTTERRKSSSANDSYVPRYNASVQSIYNSNPGRIRAYLGGRLDEDGIVRYARNSDVDNNHYGKVQAMMDRAYSASPTARQNMPDRYYDVYNALADGRGWNGYGIYADNPALQAVWKNDRLDPQAYNSLYAQGVVAGDGYLGSDGFVSGGNENAAFIKGNNYYGGSNYSGLPNVASAYLKKMLSQQEDAYDAATESAVSQLNSLKSGINQGAEKAAQQAYVNYELQKRDLPQMLSAIGMSGGESESAALAQQLSYENSRNSIVQGRDEQLNQLQFQIAQAQAQGDMQKATALSQMYNLLAGMSMQAWQTTYQADLQREMAALNQQYALEQQRQSLENEKNMYTFKQQQTGQARNLYAGSGVPKVQAQEDNSPADFGDESGASGNDGLWNPHSTESVAGDGNGWIYVSGIGRLTRSEIEQMRDSGKIRQVVLPNGQVRFVKSS